MTKAEARAIRLTRIAPRQALKIQQMSDGYLRDEVSRWRETFRAGYNPTPAQFAWFSCLEDEYDARTAVAA